MGIDTARPDSAQAQVEALAARVDRLEATADRIDKMLEEVTERLRVGHGLLRFTAEQIVIGLADGVAPAGYGDQQPTEERR